ncbi:glycoside hydrolase family 76 protein [Paenibacillus harenae]|uniref:glycoside hydrolase family 76 protein n=1 Tax=Paenibacillus harenae TaxID=306543 RepID=UPI0027913FEA|nr:glycoside hydrolase family 76 protein [Paenibacillus harenae]MDQ0062671.1 putative alpha-1,6-mannanase (GH76 family) [Paenibacillus harenae]
MGIPEQSVSAWSAVANEAQAALKDRYWNEKLGMMNQWYPPAKAFGEENFYYWWQAHVMDVLIDGLERTGEAAYRELLSELAEGVRSYNGDTFKHNYYDDMEWTALALLRAYDATGEEPYLTNALELWEDIKTAWNDHMGGGMAWKKDQLDYKNTPANAPASILAARLYRAYGKAEDLAWAVRIYEWNRENLVDLATGFVWDGINRLGDGRIDKDWKFTYCQGVFIGAGVELYLATRDEQYLQDACRTTTACFEELCAAETLLLPDEGIDDTGLFKGILIRYLLEMEKVAPPAERDAIFAVIEANALSLRDRGLSRELGLCGPSWVNPPMLPIQLSVQLSGVMLLEAMARLEKK